MKFSNLSRRFLDLSKESSRLQMTQLLAELYRELTPCESKIVTYLSLGTLRPPYKSTQFNFAQKSIEKLLADLLNKDLDSLKKLAKQYGDLGLVILNSNNINNINNINNNLTITEVYDYLCKLESISGSGAQAQKADLLLELLKQIDKVSASFIVRIITGTMRLGFSDMTIVDGLSWMLTGDKSLHNKIENAYNICADLGLIACNLKKYGTDGLDKIVPTLGIPIRLAAAERASNTAEVIKKICPCVAQPKLDGFRLQIHFSRDLNSVDKSFKVWFYSRNLQDMSYMFPDLVASLEKLKVENVIMEGEAIVYNEDTQTFLPFQETVKRKRKHNIESVAEAMPLQLFLFDILYLNNERVLDKPHEQRRELLVKHFSNLNNINNNIKVIEEETFKTAEDLDIYFNNQITQGLEGLVIKKPTAIYQPGKRNFNWIKLKRHESNSSLRDTIDAVILGYYFGKGKRADFGIGAFLVGVYNKLTDSFETVAKVGTGLKDEEWKELKAKCDKLKVKDKLSNVICMPELEPDVWVDPKIVVTILADEITQSQLHTAGKNLNRLGLALRFPRFIDYNVDKLPEQATSVKELRNLYDIQFS